MPSLDDTIRDVRRTLGDAGVDLPAAPRAPRAKRFEPPLNLAASIDHTLLKPDATRDAVLALCDEALEHGFASVCVNPTWVPLCAKRLRGRIAVCTVIGFPLGANTSAVKAEEARRAVEDGATEVDMVLAVGSLRTALPERRGADVDATLLRAIHRDVRGVVRAASGRGRGDAAITKVILETCLLGRRQKIAASLLSAAAGAHFVKTSTGFSSGGATTSDVSLMRRVVGPGIGVKASGGIRDRKGALAMLRAGANRLGCSASIAICS